MVQGSCIGSLLFTVYINDVYKIFDADTKCKFYGDAQFYSEIVTDDDHTPCKENVDALTRWSTDWQLTISTQKCFILHLGTQITFSYTLNDSVIHSPAVVKNLGVTIDKDVMFNTHINSSRPSCTLPCICNKQMLCITWPLHTASCFHNVCPSLVGIRITCLVPAICQSYKNHWIGSKSFYRQFTRLQTSDLHRTT